MKNIVEKDELHLIKLLLKNVELRVKCGTTTGQPFKTSQGVPQPQGDSISAVLFILYLAKYKKFYPHLTLVSRGGGTKCPPPPVAFLTGVN